MTKVRPWHFHQRDNLEGWTIPPHFLPEVRGGSLQISPRGRYVDHPNFSDNGQPFIVLPGMNWLIDPLLSPSDLGVSSPEARKIRLRLLNLSTETDGEIRWTNREAPDQTIGPAHFAMKPYCREWQEIICHLDEVPWTGTLDQFQIKCGLKGVRGTICIDSISFSDAPPRDRPSKPDICGAHGVPQIECPGIPQSHIDEAFAVLNDSVVSFVEPVYGFPVPFFSPGAGGAFYGKNWWLLDASLAMLPVVWTNPDFCAQMLRGFIAIQRENPDGRIDHSGFMANRGAPGDLSVIPRYFEAIEASARVTCDERLLTELYQSVSQYLVWWLSPVKRDEKTGLISGYHEESFSDHYHLRPGAVAPVDLNVAVAHGILVAIELARRLGRPADATQHQQQFDDLKAAINRTLWNEAEGAYLNYNLKNCEHEILLANHMFDPLRMGIAPKDRVEPMLKRLLDPSEFGWGGLSLSTLSRNDPKYVVIKSQSYQPEAWDGDIWTMRNLPIIFGLRDIDRHDLAAELVWQTIRVVNGSFAEFFDPEEGQGWGVQRYAWTAAQYLQTVIECLFGLTWHAETRTLRIAPLIPASVKGDTLRLCNLCLPYENCRVDLTIEPNAVLVTASSPPSGASVSLEFPGKPTQQHEMSGHLRLVLDY